MQKIIYPNSIQCFKLIYCYCLNDFGECDRINNIIVLTYE